MDRLKNKRALITGGTSGIGLETARQFIAEGARVALTGTNPVSLEAARKEFGDSAIVIPSDAASVPAQSQLAGQLKQSFGTLDVVFINAGVAELQQVPIKRFGTPTEFARTVLYFASDDSAFTVGSELLIDGGMSNL